MGWAGQSTPTKVISWIFQAKREWPSANSKEIKLKGLTSNTMEVLWMRTKEFLLRPYTKQKHYHQEKSIISFRNAIFSNLISEDLPTINPLYLPEKRTHISYNLARWSRWWYPFLRVGSYLDWPHERHLFQMDAWKIPLKSSCSHQRYIYIYTCIYKIYMDV